MTRVNKQKNTYAESVECSDVLHQIKDPLDDLGKATVFKQNLGTSSDKKKKKYRETTCGLLT